jgi:hypothetical protein
MAFFMLISAIFRYHTGMNKNLLYLIIFIIIGCNNQPKRTPKTITIVKHQKDILFADDTAKVMIGGYGSDSLFYTKGDLKKVLKYHSELTGDDFPLQPDISYALRTRRSNSDTNVADTWLYFGSEQGQDAYYGLYAHFLAIKNGRDKYRKQRNTLVKIYRDINYIMGSFAGGGTYFGHQYTRILGYAEYAIYQNNGTDCFIKTYDISKQKSLYINSLKQFINDELSTNFDISEKDKPALKKSLLKTVIDIDGLITNYFYLDKAKEFQYSNY